MLWSQNSFKMLTLNSDAMSYSAGDKAVLAPPAARSVSPASLSARWRTSSPSSLRSPRSHADSFVSGFLEAGDVQRGPHVITVTPTNAASRDASPGSMSSLVQSAVSRADDSVARSRASRDSDGLFPQPRGAAPRLVDASSYSLATASPARSFVASSDSRSSEAVSRLVAAERALAALRLSAGGTREGFDSSQHRSYTALNLSLGSSVASF
jgi:hypothetical protein